MKHKKQSGGWILIVLGILLLAVAAYTAVTNAELIFGQRVSNINKLLQQGTIESNVDSYIEINVDAVLDNFAETTHKTNGITTGKDQHYVVWLDDDSVIAVSVKNKKLVSEMDRVMDETWDYLDENRDDLTKDIVTLKGKIKKMGTEMRKYYQESLDYIGVGDAGFGIHYYQVDCTSSRITAIVATIIMLVVGILLILVFIITRKNLSKAASLKYEGPQGGYSYDYSYGQTGEDGCANPANTQYAAEPAAWAIDTDSESGAQAVSAAADTAAQILDAAAEAAEDVVIPESSEITESTEGSANVLIAGELTETMGIVGKLPEALGVAGGETTD